MTVFQTPEPISVSLEFAMGDLRLVASDSAETLVVVRPTDPTKEGDVNAAKQTRVEYASGSLLVRGPKSWRQWAPWGPGSGRESIDVEIQLPADSRVSADVAMASVRGTGRLGDLDVKTGLGDVHVDEAGSVKIRTGYGEVMVGRVDGDADVKTGSGRRRHRLDRRVGLGQELQRGHPHRRGGGPCAAAERERGDPGRQRPFAGHGKDRSRGRAIGAVVAGGDRSQDGLRSDRHRGPQWGRRLVGRLHRLRPGQQRAGRDGTSPDGWADDGDPRAHVCG